LKAQKKKWISPIYATSRIGKYGIGKTANMKFGDQGENNRIQVKIRSKVAGDKLEHVLFQDFAMQLKKGERESTMSKQYVPDKEKEHYTEVTISNVSDDFLSEYDRNVIRSHAWTELLAEKYSCYTQGYPYMVQEGYQTANPSEKLKIKPLGSLKVEFCGKDITTSSIHNDVRELWSAAAENTHHKLPDGTVEKDRPKESWYFEVKLKNKNGATSIVRGIMYYFNSFHGLETMPNTRKLRREELRASQDEVTHPTCLMRFTFSTISH